MAGRGDSGLGQRGSRARDEPRQAAVHALAGAARALEAAADRWFLWLPVLFAGGIVTYFALADEPDPQTRGGASHWRAIGLCLAAKHAPLGLAIGGALLAFAFGFATAKLRTEMARAPVLANELRYVAVTGFVETHELRDKGRARLTLTGHRLGRSCAGTASLSRARDAARQGWRKRQDRRGRHAESDASAAA